MDVEKHYKAKFNKTWQNIEQDYQKMEIHGKTQPNMTKHGQTWLNLSD